MTKPLAGTLRLQDIPFEQMIAYNLDQSLPWVDEMLQDLVAGQSHNLDTSFISLTKEKILIALTFLRKNTPRYREHLIIDGTVNACYNAACVKCLAPTPIDINIDFKTAHLNSSHENAPEFADTHEVYMENAERELYFFSKGTINIQEMLKEYLFMGIAPFPVHSKDCLGLCPDCGVNLNYESCPHQSVK